MKNEYQEEKRREMREHKWKYKMENEKMSVKLKRWREN